MEKLRILPKTRQGNLFVVVRMDRHTESTKVMPTPMTSATAVARIFLQHRVSNFGIPSKELTENGFNHCPSFLQLCAVCLG